MLYLVLGYVFMGRMEYMINRYCCHESLDLDRHGRVSLAKNSFFSLVRCRRSVQWSYILIRINDYKMTAQRCMCVFHFFLDNDQDQEYHSGEYICNHGYLTWLKIITSIESQLLDPFYSRH